MTMTNETTDARHGALVIEAQKLGREAGQNAARSPQEPLDMNGAEFSFFHVTGTDLYGRRFRLVYKSAIGAFGINLWCGSVWGVREDGTRKLLRRVWN